MAFKNIVTCYLRDAETLELKEKQITENTVTITGEYWHTRLSFFYRLYGLRVHEQEVVEDLIVLGKSDRGAKYHDSTLQDWTRLEVGSRVFYERESRFQPPSSGNTRVINVVTINGPDDSCMAYSPLTNTFIQQDNEVVDIVYRVEYKGDFTSANLNVGSRQLEWLFDINEEQHYHDVVLRAHAFDELAKDARFSKTYEPSNYDYEHRIDTEDRATESHLSPYHRFRDTFSEGDEVGRLFRSFHLHFEMPYVKDKVVGWGNLIPDDFAYHPVQVIHNHREDAYKPFQHVDKLAYGSGYVDVQVTNDWQNKPMMDFFYIRIAQTGTLAESSYYFSKMPITGFFGNDYRVYTGHTSYPRYQGKRILFPNDSNDSLPNYGYHGYIQVATDYAVYPWYIVWGFEYVCISNASTNKVIIFGSIDEPDPDFAVSFARVQRVISLPNGIVWVADRDSGLYRITNPLNPSPVIKKYSDSDGVPGGSRCYSVCEGYNGSVWAVFENGIARTDDDGASWVSYDTHPVLTELNIATYSHIHQIEADINDPNHALALVRANKDEYTKSTVYFYLYWWSPVKPYIKGNIGVHSGYLHRQDNGEQNLRFDASSSYYGLPPLVRCDRSTSYWFGTSNYDHRYDSVTHFFYLIWGTKRLLGTFGGNHPREEWGFVHPMPLLHDYYGNLITSSDVMKNSQVREDRTVYAAYANPYNKNYFMAPAFDYRSGALRANVRVAWEKNEKRGEQGFLIKAFKDGHNHMFSQFPIFKDDTGSYPDFPEPFYGSFYVEGSPLHEIAMRTDTWNPVSGMWEQDYRTDLTDISGNNRHAPRMQFPVESHYFNGHSCIDLTFLEGQLLTNDGITIAMSALPDEKLVREGEISSLLSFKGIGFLMLDIYDRASIRDTSLYGAIDTTTKRDIPETIQSAAYFKQVISKASDTFVVDPASYYRAVITVKSLGLRPFMRNVWTSETAAQNNEKAFEIEADTENSFDLYSLQNSQPNNSCKRLVMLFNENRGAPASTDFSVRFKFERIAATTSRMGFFLGVNTSSDTRYELYKDRVIDNVNTSVYIEEQLTSDPSWNRFSMATVNPSEAADFDGTNTLDVRFYFDDVAGVWRTSVRRDVGGTLTTLIESDADQWGVHEDTIEYSLMLHMGAVSDTDVTDTDGRIRITNFEIVDNNDAEDLYQYGKGESYECQFYIDAVLQEHAVYTHHPDTEGSRIADPAGMDSLIRVGCITDNAGHGGFFKGNIKNLQVWNHLFTPAEITDDESQASSGFSQKTSMVSSTDLVAHYSIDEDLALTETKPLHTDHQELGDTNVTVSFTDGAVPPAFQRGDFYTTGVGYGILKDNVTTFTYDKYLFTKPTQVGFSYIESTATNPGTFATAVPAVSSQAYKAPVVMAHTTNHTESRRCYGDILGQTCMGVGNYNGSSGDYRKRSFEHLLGDGEFAFRLGTSPCVGEICLGSVSSSNSSRPTHCLIMRFNLDDHPTAFGKRLLVSRNDTNEVLYDGTYNRADAYRYVRSGSTHTLYRNSNVIATFTDYPDLDAADIQLSLFGGGKIYTDSGDFYNEEWPIVLYDMTLTSKRDVYSVLEMGNSISKTGKYSPAFGTFSYLSEHFKVLLDGGQAVVKVHDPVNRFTNDCRDYGFQSIAALGLVEGEVLIIPSAGTIYCHPNDAGKLIEVNAVLIERK